ncbi:hypothetical protein NQ317_009771 [Molorchus minor]|uniref:Myosuppressin n=1 Tax=Molorchus minor TaxID=1323400 RepID=A0ABQ9K2R3_9CUCU|nr:hypothetical protein NQ317_009771 [Molorchus minor]
MRKEEESVRRRERPLYKRPTAKFKPYCHQTVYQKSVLSYPIHFTMQIYTSLSTQFFLAIIMAILTTSVVNSTIINCPPNTLQEQQNPTVRQLCYAVEQIVDDGAPVPVLPPQPQYFGRLEERNTNLNSKRQDVDHVFLRFGRRFGF